MPTTGIPESFVFSRTGLRFVSVMGARTSASQPRSSISSATANCAKGSTALVAARTSRSTPRAFARNCMPAATICQYWFPKNLRTTAILVGFRGDGTGPRSSPSRSNSTASSFRPPFPSREASSAADRAAGSPIPGDAVCSRTARTSTESTRSKTMADTIAMPPRNFIIPPSPVSPHWGTNTAGIRQCADTTRFGPPLGRPDLRKAETSTTAAPGRISHESTRQSITPTAL